MKRKMTRGNSMVEFSFVLILLVPLFLGTTVVGVNMVKSLQTVQLARDAGHMFARGVDFSLPGNQTILTKLGANLGLKASATASNAVVILSVLTYVDNATCLLGGCAKDAAGNAIDCTNKGQWVFIRPQLKIGRPSVRTSNLGSPLIGSGPTEVIVNSEGTFDPSEYVKKPGAVATFSGINPYTPAVAGGAAASGLPSGQVLYISEASAMGLSMKPYMVDHRSYSFGIF